MEDDDAALAFGVLSDVSAAALAGALDAQLAHKIASRLGLDPHGESVDLTELARELERRAWRVRDSMGQSR